MPNEIEQLTDALRDNKVCRTVSAAKIDIIFENANFLLENQFLSCIFYVFMQIYRK